MRTNSYEENNVSFDLVDQSIGNALHYQIVGAYMGKIRWRTNSCGNMVVSSRSEGGLGGEKWMRRPRTAKRRHVDWLKPKGERLTRQQVLP